MGQACTSEASPLIVPASCRRARITERAQAGFFLGAAQPEDVFNLVIPVQPAEPDWL